MNRREAIAAALGGVIGAEAVASGVARADLAPIGRGRVRGERPEPRREGGPRRAEYLSPRTTEEGVKLLTDVRQAQRFTDAPVRDEDVKKIVMCGLNAPSALNLQPWFFTVVTDRELLREIDKAAGINPDDMNQRLSTGRSPLVIFISTDESDYGRYDVGVAADRMNVAANLLGYGCKTVATSPKAANQPQFKGKLHIPEGYRVIAALLIGTEVERSVDGVSGATTREPLDKKFYFVNG